MIRFSQSEKSLRDVNPNWRQPKLGRAVSLKANVAPPVACGLDFFRPGRDEFSPSVNRACFFVSSDLWGEVHDAGAAVSHSVAFKLSPVRIADLADGEIESVFA